MYDTSDVPLLAWSICAVNLVTQRQKNDIFAKISVADLVWCRLRHRSTQRVTKGFDHTQYMYESVSERQLPHKIVNLLLIITNTSIELTVLWGG